jgi:hypothetical protein
VSDASGRTVAVAYRSMVDDVVFTEQRSHGELRVSEVGTLDDSDTKCVDLSCLWINACCDSRKEPGDEVCLNRAEVARLAATLMRWAETGVLLESKNDAGNR